HALRAALKSAVESDRLLLLSPFKPRDHLPTAKLAEERNRFVAALATEAFITYAAEGGKTEQPCRNRIAAGKLVFTFDATPNARLIAIGCNPVTAAGLVSCYTERHLRNTGTHTDEPRFCR